MDYRAALALAITVAKQAGAMLRAEFHRPGGPRGQANSADVDAEIETYLQQALLRAFPWNYLGEELGWRPGTDTSHLWLIDPHDGTNPFLRGWRGTSISIGALRDGLPILGVVFAPLYPDDRGDQIAWAEGEPLTRNGVVVPARSPIVELSRRDIVIVSQDADRAPLANTGQVSPAGYHAMPSTAYRMARAAVGDGVGTVSLAKPKGWDIAAGHALLRAAGLTLVNESGEPIVYSPQGQVTLTRAFGGAPALAAHLAGRSWNQVFERDRLPGEESVPPRFSLCAPNPSRHVADADQLARAQGCLFGQFIGDSLGGLVEFRSAEQIAAIFPQGVRDLLDGGHWGNLAGQITDDSELALMLARSLVEHGEYRPDAVLDQYVRWYRDPGTYDIGGTIARALGAASQAEDSCSRLRLVEQYADHTRPTNGSLMRISPLGIATAGDPTLGAALARVDSGLTHPHLACRDACAVFVATLAEAIARGGTPRTVYSFALAEARRAQAHPDILDALVAADTSAPRNPLDRMGWVVIAFQNAFHQLLHAPSVEEGIIASVALGGDTDTNAAIAGALLGAVHGRDALPWRWRSPILACRPLPGTLTRHPRPPEFWTVDTMQLAEALLLTSPSIRDH